MVFPLLFLSSQNAKMRFLHVLGMSVLSRTKTRGLSLALFAGLYMYDVFIYSAVYTVTKLAVFICNIVRCGIKFGKIFIFSISFNVFHLTISLNKCYSFISLVGKKPKVVDDVVQPSRVAKVLKVFTLSDMGCEALHLTVPNRGAIKFPKKTT